MPRVLYIDVPFEDEPGGDKNRSRFLFNTLGTAFETDLLLVHPHKNQPARATHGLRHKPILELQAQPPGWFHSHSVFRIDPRQNRAYLDLLSARRYDAVVCRFHSPWFLALGAHAHPSRPAVVMDLDMVSSRLVGLTWRQDPSIRNRWFLFERIKLERLERNLLHRPWQVLFSNPVERDQMALEVERQGTRVRLGVLPNILVAPTLTSVPETQSIILFFGSLNSAANTDAFRYLMQDILPLIDADLRRHQVRIHVAGKNPPPWFSQLIQKSGSDRVILVGRVDSMETAIAESRFVFLPLRVASGTRTRILEAAAQLRTVVTTPLGAEGIAVGTDALIANGPQGLAASIRRLLDAPDRAVDLGRRLCVRCRDRYGETRIAGEFLGLLKEHLQAHRATAAA
jgi:glycosyltransferase involved in cell wall biosynthesis